MLVYKADEVVLETEITNIPALRLYENLGFVRDKRLFDYYLNGVDALRLKLWFKWIGSENKWDKWQETKINEEHNINHTF